MVSILKKTVLIDWLVALGLFAVALWLRTTSLAHFVTADEHNWVYRSGLFLNALLQQDWLGTSVWYTPAVTTTWLGSGSLALFYQTHQETINRPLGEWLVSFSRNKIDLDILLALRWSVALFTSLMAMVVYGLARKLWSLPVALLGTLFLITEPHLLAVSRIIGHDALITFFVISSLLSFFYAKRMFVSPSCSQTGVWEQERKEEGVWKRVKTGPYGWFMLSGLFAGLAILSKAPALILIPFTILVAIVDTWLHRDRLSRWIWAGAIWGGALCLTFIVLWPAAWINPLGQLWYVISSAFFSSTGSEDGDIQPYWSIPGLGYFYYLVNGAYKISPLLFIGIILAAGRAVYQLWRNRLSWQKLPDIEFFWLVLFTVLFALMMTFGAKQSPRYILPVFPALTFVAAWGWLSLSTLPFVVKQPVLRHYWKTGTIIVLGLLAVLFTLNYAPYYFTYFNPLLGGSNTASQTVRIGWGEGLDELGRWLNARPNAQVEHAGARYTVALHPFFQGSISSPVSEELDYVAFYIKQTQSGYPTPEILAYFENQKPLHTVVLNNIEYVQVYQGPGMQLVEPQNHPGLPIAFRPHTIYAPIGQRLTVDLLWAEDGPQNNSGPVNLILQSPDGLLRLESSAEIIQKAAGVNVSTHTFEIPHEASRETFDFLISDKPIGQIKARLIDIPPNYQPHSAVLAGQLKLAGVHYQIEEHTLLLNLAWQGWPAAITDYTVFVQLLDDNGQRITGIDAAPEPGFTALDRKEVMLTHYNIPLPDDLSPDTYSLLVGLYYFAGDELINVGTVTLEPEFIQ